LVVTDILEFENQKATFSWNESRLTRPLSNYVRAVPSNIPSKCPQRGSRRKGSKEGKIENPII